MRGTDWQEVNGTWLRTRLNWSIFSGFIAWLFIAASLGILIACIVDTRSILNKMRNVDSIVEHRLQSWCASKDEEQVYFQMSALQDLDFETFLSFYSPNATIFDHDSSLPQGGPWSGFDYYDPRSIPAYFWMQGEYLEWLSVNILANDLHNCGGDKFGSRIAIQTLLHCPANYQITSSLPYNRELSIITQFNWKHQIIRQDIYADNSPITSFLIQQCGLSMPAAASSIRPSSITNTTINKLPMHKKA